MACVIITSKIYFYKIQNMYSFKKHCSNALNQNLKSKIVDVTSK